MSRPAGGLEYDVAVIGAGIVGLASALQLLRHSRTLKLVVIEREPRLAAHQSSHNSGVVHTGLYYRPGSLKTRLCRDARAELLRFAEKHGIPYERRGKLVVATSEREFGRLEELHNRGRANGVEGMRLLAAHELGAVEPAVSGRRALHVPESYVISYASVALAYSAEITGAGGDIVLGFPVTALDRRDGHYAISSGERRITARRVVVCAGLWADRMRRLAGGAGPERILPFRGDYYTLTGKSAALVRGLVYPVPDPTLPFLGVHFTRGIDGEVHAGPNAVLALARKGYRRRDVNLRDMFDVLRFPGSYRLAVRYPRTALAEVWRDWVKPAYVREARRYIPELDAADMRFGPSRRPRTVRVAERRTSRRLPARRRHRRDHPCDQRSLSRGDGLPRHRPHGRTDRARGRVAPIRRGPALPRALFAPGAPARSRPHRRCGAGRGR